MNPLPLALLVAPLVPGDALRDQPPPHVRGAVECAPPLADCWRFPPRGAVTRNREFNYSFRSRLAEEREVWPASVQYRFDAALRESEWRYRCWDALDDALYEWRPAWRRRLALAALRDLLGDEDYAAGRMPAAVPARVFRDLR